MKILSDNPLLSKYSSQILQRHQNFQNALSRINSFYGSIDNFTISYRDYGLHKIDGGIFYREWVPNAKNVYLCGDFNGWNSTDPSTKCDANEFGVFTLFLPDSSRGEPRIKHNTRVRVFIERHNGEIISRIPAWINYTAQSKKYGSYDGVFWNPPINYEYKHPWPEPRTECAFLIYECHIGMAGEEPRVHTYNEFTQNVLPIVKERGYNAVQLMGIMQHSYYASAGYQVTSFFAPCSRFGTPDDLKKLIDTAHSLGIYVFLDTIHSHASKNIGEGLNMFNGEENQYFHPGNRGTHPIWDSKLFNYGNIEVQRFLLSNLRYYIDVFHFDGFRFDGVGSMIYKNQGINVSFDNMDIYFNPNIVDEDAITYLCLANYVIHKYDMFAITSAEDVSGMIGIARPIEEGGMGFDFRLGMGGADLWVHTLESNQKWDCKAIVYGLNNRPLNEKTIGYTECHDQPFPIIYRLLGYYNNDPQNCSIKKMEDDMSFVSPSSERVENGISLLKLIRLITFGISGEAYLNFMGNEFGHPGKIEFPHEGNGNSFVNCVRKFHLADDEMSRFSSLKKFDHGMIEIERNYKFLNRGDLGYITTADNENMIITFERGGLLWIFNFSENNYEHYIIGVVHGGKYKCIFSTDDFNYAGQSRIIVGKTFETVGDSWNSLKYKVELKLFPYTAFVLRLIEPSSP